MMFALLGCVARLCADKTLAYLPQEHERLKERFRRRYLIDFEDFGMEAAWRIEVQDFPAFLMIDDKGNEFFDKLTPSAQAVRFTEQGPKAR